MTKCAYADTLNFTGSATNRWLFFAIFLGFFLVAARETVNAGHSPIAPVNGLSQVSRWGKPGLETGDWVMKGSMSWRNYVFSGKWQPGFSNTFAPYSTGATYVVENVFLKIPPGVLGKLKGLLG